MSLEHDLFVYRLLNELRELVAKMTYQEERNSPEWIDLGGEA